MSQDEIFGPERALLREIRDELRVQAHLGQAELRDQLQDFERRWHRLEGSFKAATETARQDAEEVRTAAEKLADEIREGFEHLRARL